MKYKARKIPRKLNAGEENHRFASPEDKYRVEYFSVIDTTIKLLKQYFDSPGIREYKSMSDMLIKGIFNAGECDKYPELNNTLEERLKLFSYSVQKQANSVLKLGS